MGEQGVAEAASEAERLAAAVEHRGSLEPVYERLDTAIAELTAAGYQPSDLLPVDAEPGIGFSLNEKRDGRTLWEAIAVAGRSSLCDRAGEVRRLMGVKGVSAGSLVTAVMTSLGLPPMAIPIAVSIVAVLLAIGIQGFCEWTAAAPDEPAAP
jgi:hypothetical protein